MKAVIMAGGEGTRLRPLTCNLAKPMIPLMNKPMMEHILALLKKASITEIANTLWYRPQDITDYFQDGTNWGVEMRYFVEETPLGTAGSVKNAQDYLNEPFLVVSGDSLTDIDLTQAIQFHQENQALVTIVLKRVPTPLEYGVVITNEQGQIVRFLEKPDWSQVFSDTVNSGIYLLQPEVFEHIPSDKPFDFSRDLFPSLLKAKAPLYGYIAEGYWSDVGNLEVYSKSHGDCLDRLVDIALPEPLSSGVYVEEGAEISPSAKIVAPVFIGKGALIEDHATVGPYTVVGSNSKIGEKAKIKHTTLWHNVQIGPNSKLSGTIVAKGSRLEQGIEAYEGSVIGEDVSVGELSIIRPRTKVWPGKDIPSGSRINDSIIWGNMEYTSLFSQQGIVGELQGTLTPERITKIGLSLAAYWKNQGNVVLTGDESPEGRIARRSLINGLISGGVNALDCGVGLDAVTRFAINYLQASGGIHCQSLQANRLKLTCYDQQGLPFAKGDQRKVDNVFAREDFPRVDQTKLGKVSFIPEMSSKYMANVEQLFASKLARQAIVVKARDDAGLWGKLAKGFLENWQETNSKADIFVEITPHGWKIFDQKGKEFSSENYLDYFIHSLKKRGVSRVGLPINSPQSRVQKAQELGVEVLFAPQNTRRFMEIADELGNTYQESNGHQLYPVIDPLISLLDALALFNEDEDIQPSSRGPFHQEEIICPWEKKGLVMRGLIENALQREATFIDGIKEEDRDGWVMVIPDGDHPTFQVFSEATSLEEAKRYVADYRNKIQVLMETEGLT